MRQKNAMWVFLGSDPKLPIPHLRPRGVELSDAERDRQRRRYLETRQSLGWTHETVGTVFGYTVETCQRWACWYAPPEAVLQIMEALAGDRVAAAEVTRLVLQDAQARGVVIGTDGRRRRGLVKRKLIPGKVLGRRRREARGQGNKDRGQEKTAG
jgi:hypothetical protein